MMNRNTKATLLVTLAFAMLTVSQVHAADEAGLPTADPASVGMSADALAKIPDALSGLIDNGNVPGFVTMVARNGKVVHFEAFGKRDVERDRPMTKDTIFRMYSMTKPVTGTAIMILVDEGKIDVDDPVSKFIPEFESFQVATVGEDGEVSLAPAKTTMTIKHLLTHTSGLFYGSEDAVKKSYVKNRVNSGARKGVTLEEFAQNVAAVPLLCEPGTEWHYGISMDVLGRVVEVASGQNFGAFLEERIFEPLGMHDSGFSVPAKDIERFASNYGPTDDGGMRRVDDGQKSPYHTEPSMQSGGGGMVGTAADYMRFAQMLLNGGELEGTRIISSESCAEMMKHQLDPSLGDNPLGNMLPIMSKGIGFGYTGAVVLDGYERTLFGPAGTYSWGGAASTDFWIDTKQQLIGMSLTQLMPSGTYPNRVLMLNATTAAIAEKY